MIASCGDDDLGRWCELAKATVNSEMTMATHSWRLSWGCLNLFGSMNDQAQQQLTRGGWMVERKLFRDDELIPSQPSAERSTEAITLPGY